MQNVENILKDNETIPNKPLYRAVRQHIRQKVREPADVTLISYNIFNESLEAIKKYLSLHYADKRDIRTLEYQLTLMNQGNRSIDEFYAKVNQQFSTIVNKIKSENHSKKTLGNVQE